MKILAIDTSNFVLGVALYENGKVIGEYITNLKRIIRLEQCQQLNS